jgi:hypothetical protein
VYLTGRYRSAIMEYHDQRNYEDLDGLES